MMEEKSGSIWVSTMQGEVLLHKLIKKPQKKYNVYTVGVIQAGLLLLGADFWYYGYIRILTGRIPEYMRAWKVTMYLLWLWMLTNAVLLIGIWYFKLLIWRRSEKFLRKGAAIYRFELKQCPSCGGSLELYQERKHLIFRCFGAEACCYYIEGEKLLELLDED